MAVMEYAKFSGRLGICFSAAAPGAVSMLDCKTWLIKRLVWPS